jgi:hypothetical protein
MLAGVAIYFMALDRYRSPVEVTASRSVITLSPSGAPVLGPPVATAYPSTGARAPAPNPPGAPAQAPAPISPPSAGYPAPSPQASAPNSTDFAAYPSSPVHAPAPNATVATAYPPSVARTSAPRTSAPVASAPTAAKKDDADASCRQHMLTLGVVLAATDPCVELDTLIKNLQVGTYSFNQPPSAYVEEPFIVVLTLQTAAGQDVSNYFQSTAGERKSEPGKWAQNLEAKLHGLDFKIDPEGPQERTVTEGAPVQWRWTVSAQSAGKKNLYIDVNAILTVGPAKNRYFIRTLEDQIQVNVTYFQMILSAFTGLWGLLLGAATMLIAILSALHYWPSKNKTGHDRQSGESPPVELIAHHHIHTPDSPQS